MEKNAKWYNFINVAVVGITALIFSVSYRNVTGIFYGMDFPAVAILAATVFLVHFIKAVRLYFALYGAEFKFKDYIKTYCKVTPVSVVMPLKSGELFRMYCYGRQVGNVIKGIVIILLDRFMDTAALLTVIGLVRIFYGGHMPPVAYLLLVFLIFILLVYSAFSGVCQFWKRYLLCARATENKLFALKMLETLNIIYQEVAGVARGRGLILYFMSLAAWGIEITGISLLDGLSENGRLNQMISGYLAAAMGGSQSVYLNRFVFSSVLLLIAVYVFMEVMEIIHGKKGDKA